MKTMINLLLTLTFFLHLTPSSPFSIASKSSTTQKWEPKIKNLSDRKEALRNNAQHSKEHINSIGYHHIEFYCGDAKSTALSFSLSLGMKVTCTTGQNTGNDQCVSYGLQSEDMRFLITAPYSTQVSSSSSNSSPPPGVTFDSTDPLPSFSIEDSHDFFRNHGLGVKAVGIEVLDAKTAFDNSVSNGAWPMLEPTFIPACAGYLKELGIDEDKDGLHGCTISEVELYGDVVLRYISFPTKNTSSALPFLPHLAPHSSKNKKSTYGIKRIDHAVGNVPDLLTTQNYISSFTGFHEFAEFTAEDVGTIESGLNSVVLASDSEYVLLPINEPTAGKRKSQIQTFLEQNEGAGLQHLALKTDDIFQTITKMREAEEDFGGFEFMRRPSQEYFEDLPNTLGDQLTPEQYKKCEELGILADADEEGVLLQIFTKPIGDRPTFFFEIIQRIGCLYNPTPADEEKLQKPGCGGFGRGNFKELFKAIEVSFGI